jgi:hypothetical protein
MMQKGQVPNDSRRPASEIGLDLVNPVPANSFFKRRNGLEARPPVRPYLGLDRRTRDKLLAPAAPAAFEPRAACDPQRRLLFESCQQAIEMVARHGHVSINLDHYIWHRFAKRRRANLDGASYQAAATKVSGVRTQLDVYPRMRCSQFASNFKCPVIGTGINNDPLSRRSRLPQEGRSEPDQIVGLVPRYRHHTVREGRAGWASRLIAPALRACHRTIINRLCRLFLVRFS